ncbi:purple acid phosphatase family protein [Frigoriglobus tundricola]|uniref:Calcineurin-like phosphoesterase domain-containing protein n=1 Tax=Frigoriglobus tundricola TaxID=2774151 RepID=A0A6M5YFI6_9BACT|nr:metallophosphoesterase family protein [Frigoriglobus tundricola]QJW92785.1 hypothetical protein FTUN_0282 [Frigoriglobus tundricola]
MLAVDRRSFLGTSIPGLAAALVGPALVRAGAPSAQRPDTLFLTWQRDPTTTITVQWIGTQSEVPDVYVSKWGATGAAWSATHASVRPFPLTNLRVFRVEVTGLLPDTEYQFRIGTQPATYRFRTMPVKATDTFSFVSGGDCGVNAHAAVVNALAAKQDPRFVVIGGDLAYDNGSSPESVLGFLRSYNRHMTDSAGRLVPMLACVGNHEVAGGYSRSRADAPLFLSLFDGLFRDTSYAALDFGDYLSLVLLDTGHVSAIGGDQTDWLRKVLSERADRPHLIVANHVPAYPSYRAPDGSDGTGADNRKYWCPLFERYGVDAVLEHHDHTFKRTHPLTGGLRNRYGVPYLGDGSWGQLRAPNSPEKRPYLAAVGQAYHMTVHRLEGEQRYHIAMEEGGKLADAYSTCGKRPAKKG